MRRILIAMTAVAGLALLGMSAPSAMPLNGLSTTDPAASTDQVTKVGGHWRWGSRGGHWRWGSRGHRCHARWRSVWVWC